MSNLKKILLGIAGVGVLGVVGATAYTPPPVTYALPTQVITVTSTASPTATHAAASLSNNKYYTNVDGNQVHSPAYSNTAPAGATAQCGDGTYSFSLHHSGTCSHHGGVAEWL